MTAPAASDSAPVNPLMLRPQAVRLLMVIFLLPLVGYDLWLVGAALRALGGDAPGDFFALWSFGNFARHFPLPLIYDRQALHAYQIYLGGVAYDAPFPYPPHYALLLAPFTLFGLPAGYCLWVVATFITLACAVLIRQADKMMALVLLLPATIIGLVAGQNGLLSAALLIGGMRLSRDRPVAGGVLIGLLTYKPQLGVLVPVALIAARRWRAVAAAAGCAATIVVAVGLLYGWRCWADWAQSLHHHAALYSVPRSGIAMMPTVNALFLLCHAPMWLAQSAQIISVIGAAATIWWCWRRDQGPLALAALCVATFFATPYAFAYDLPMVAVAIGLFVRHRLQRGAVDIGTLFVVMLNCAMPMLLNDPKPRVPTGIVALLSLLGLIVREVAIGQRVGSGEPVQP